MIKQFDWKFSTNNELFADLKVTELPDNKKPMTKMFRYDLEFNEDTHWKLVQLSALRKMHQEDFVEELLTCVMEVLLMDEEEEEDTQANHIPDATKMVQPPVPTDEEMTELLPSAQTVLDAANMVFSQAGTTAQGIAAALRAAADQVVPHPGRYPMSEYMEGLRNAKHDVRAKILAIATELEGHA